MNRKLGFREKGLLTSSPTRDEIRVLIVALFCAGEVMDYVARMDWQQLLALLIVTITAGLFLWSKVRRKKFSFAKSTHCGCSSAQSPAPSQTIQFKARKGQRPTVVVKNR